jgi:hypothetical protein
MSAVSDMGPIRILDFDYPDDDDFEMMSGGRLYSMSAGAAGALAAGAAGALAAGAMMLGDAGDVSMRLGSEHLSRRGEYERAWCADPEALAELLARLPEHVQGTGAESDPQRDRARDSEKG